MKDVIITGASRGIGAALARALASPERRLVLVARDPDRLEAIASDVRAANGQAATCVGDLSLLAHASELGQRLTALCSKEAMLIHNAGIWPSKKVMTDDGFERAFVVNHLGPLAMQAPLLSSGRLSRVMVCSAGLIVKGRFDPARTPTGDDFSGFRTYCSTKLCFAIAMRALAIDHPELDVVILHPGVVRTELGARGGVLGWLLSRVKRRWESPEDCAARLSQLVDQPRWSPPGAPRWLVESDEADWPAAATDEATAHAVMEATRTSLATIDGNVRPTSHG